MDAIVQDLQNIEDSIDDEDLVILLLCPLHPSYKHFAETLIYGRVNLCSEDVRKASLTQKDLVDSQFTQKVSIESNDTLFGKGLSMKRSMTCNYCRKKDHLKKDC